jgi:hypothetical protein
MFDRVTFCGAQLERVAERERRSAPTNKKFCRCDTFHSFHSRIPSFDELLDVPASPLDSKVIVPYNKVSRR